MLPGFYLDSLPFEEWLTVEREHLHRQAMEAFYHLADCHNQRGEYRQAQGYARRQLELEPWREEAQRQLMAALALSAVNAAPPWPSTKRAATSCRTPTHPSDPGSTCCVCLS